jgi:hypothetical protein
VLILLAVIGIILLVWGAQATNSVFISVGASLTCVGISLFIDSLLTKDVVEILREFTTSKFLSEENMVKDFRRKYYAYWVTKINNVTYWWHAVYDFSNNISPGKLIADIELKSATSNELKEYYCEAVMKGDKLIFVITAKKGVEANIVGFLQFGHAYDDTSYGINIFESYDKDQITTPVILSLTPIQNWTNIGKICDVNVSNYLWNIWKSNFKLYI